MAKIERLDLVVEGNAIHCSGCESRIETVLSKLPGVVRAKADHKTQKVSLALDTEKTSLGDVKRKLEVAGFRTG